jgi:hypothetical protein
MRCLPPKLNCSLALIAAMLLPSAISAQQPLHEKVDALVVADQFFGVGPVASDSEFMRRVYLDLIGSVPTAEEARQFLADEAADKRAKLVQSLVNDPRINHHLTTVFDVMWIERTGDKHVTSVEWRKYLYDSFVANKQYDQLAREILAADGSDDKIRPAARFYLAREGEVNRLTRDVGRMFLGMDLQCAQCHDHPLIESYYQSDYYGVFAFLNRGALFTAKDKKVFYAEKAEGTVSFKSVFTEEEGETGPRLPGDIAIIEPVVKLGDEYTVKPAKEVRGIPRYSRRQQLADHITSGKNTAFNNNIANRLWAQMFGRGIVHPVDLHHADNPPLNPELLDLIGSSFAEMKFDIKQFLAEIALTNAYQRAYETPTDIPAVAAAGQQRLAPLAAELESVKAQGSEALKVFGALVAELDVAVQARAPFKTKQVELLKALGEAIKPDDEAQKALVAANTTLAAKTGQLTPVAATLGKTKEALALIPADEELKALVAVYQTRHDALQSEATALRKDQEAKQAKATETATLRTSRQAEVDAGYTELGKHDQIVAEVEQRYQDSRTVQERFRQIQFRLESQQADAEQVVKLGELTAQRDQLSGQLTTTREQLATAQQSAASLTADMPAMENRLAEATALGVDLAQQLDDIKPGVLEQRQRTTLVATVLAKAELVQEKLPEDKELAAAAVDLKAAHQVEIGRQTKLDTTFAQLGTDKVAADKLTSQADLTLTEARGQLQKLEQEIPLLEQKVPELENQLLGVIDQQQISAAKTTDAWSRRFAVSGLKPLSPEQFGWTLMQAVGLVQQTRVGVVAELDKNSPLSDEDKADSAKVVARHRQVEEQVYDKLKGNVNQFITLFGAGTGQPQDDFFATVDQALFVANGGPIRGWVNPTGNNLASRLGKTEDPTALAEELYLSVFTRRPTESEIADVGGYLAERSEERPVAIQEMIWALLASAEFRFSH